MNREDFELIELGSVSEETQGLTEKPEEKGGDYEF